MQGSKYPILQVRVKPCIRNVKRRPYKGVNNSYGTIPLTHTGSLFLTPRKRKTISLIPSCKPLVLRNASSPCNKFRKRVKNSFRENQTRTKNGRGTRNQI